MFRFLVLIVIATAHQAGAVPLFDENPVLNVTLSGPISSVFRDKVDRAEKPFTLTFDGTSYAIDARLRGNSRVRVCGFPPLRLNFDESKMQMTVFAGQDKLKLVTHCRNHDRGEQDLLEEYAAYRIFNVISDISFRVRLLRIHYEDTDRALNKKASPRYGFVLEPDWQLAQRVGAVPAELTGVPKRRYDREHAALVFVFQYLIANTDWGFVKADYDDFCCHNGDLLDIDKRVFFVPYDFDIAGIVNAQYAFPDPSLRIDEVTQRIYRGLCMDGDTVQAALRDIKARKAQILQVLREIPGLSRHNAARGERFLRGFFDKAEDEQKLLRLFEKRCL